MGAFSVPSLMPSKVLSGAIGRYREYQADDRKQEEAKRERYINHLSALMDVAADEESQRWLADEITRTVEAPVEKPFKPRPMPAPTSMGGRGMGTKGQAGQGAQGQASQGATPSFDFREVMAAITGSGGMGGQSGAAGA